MNCNISKYIKVAQNANILEYIGKVTKVIGLTIESKGPEVNIGDLCSITSNKSSDKIPAEVVGFKDGAVLLMPLGNIEGIGPGSNVIARSEVLRVSVSKQLVGRVLDGLGKPMDGKHMPEIEGYYPVQNNAPHPLTRQRIESPLGLGVKCMDGLLTIGKGQRVGIFAGSGVGKSTIMGMIARNTNADINVIALVGERGREVREFLERDLGEEGLKNPL